MPKSSRICLLGIVVRKCRAAGQTVHQQLGTVGLRPEREVGQHRLVQIRHRRIDAGGVGKRSQAHLRVGNHADAALRFRLPETFVIAEQKQPVLLERPAQRAAELVLAERRIEGGLRKEAARIESAVAEKLEQRSMQRIGPGLRDHADLRAGSLPVFGAVGVGLDVELADGVDAQQVAAHAARSDGELARPGVLNAVEQHQIVHGPPSIHRERISVAGAGVGAFQAVVDDAGVQGHQIVEAAAVERQVLHFALSDESRNRGRGGVDHGGLFGDGHFLREIANLEPQIHHRFLPDHQIDAVANLGLEAGLFGPAPGRGRRAGTGRGNRPRRPVVTARVAPVSRLLTVTATPRMPAPEASSTFPEMAAVT